MERVGEPKDYKKTTKGRQKTEDHKKQRLATIKRLKRGDANELERKLRLEKVVAGKRHGRIKNTGEDASFHTAQVGPGDRGRKKSKKRIGFDLE